VFEDDDNEVGNTPVQLTKREKDHILDELIAVSDVRERVAVLLSSLKPIRITGFFLLMLFALYSVEILIPPKFMNPDWEMVAMNSLLEIIFLPVLGLSLVFWGGNYHRKQIDKFNLWFFSWVALWLGLACFLLVPMATLDSFRILRGYKVETSTKIESQMVKIAEVENQVREARSHKALETVLRRASSTPTPVDRNQELAVIKEGILVAINAQRKSVEETANKAYDQSVVALWKRLVRVAIGFILAGVYLVAIWYHTLWAREQWLVARGKVVG